MKDNSKFNDRVKSYMADGMSEIEAKQKATLDSIGDVALAGAGGFVAGGITGGLVNTGKYILSRGQTDVQIGASVKSDGKLTELLMEALDFPVSNPAHQLAQTLLSQQQTALTELGMALSDQHQLPRSEQAQLAAETANNAVSDQTVGELARLVEANAKEDAPKEFQNKNDYGTMHSEVQAFSSQQNNQPMPYYAEAVTPVEKFVNYSLDYSNKNAAGKAEAYERGLGYTQANADSLIKQIHNAVTSGETVPYQMSSSEYGTKYKFRIAVTGPNGKTKNVIAVYQIDVGQEIPRLITNYMEGK